MADNTCVNEEKLIKLIKDAFTEEFKKQEIIFIAKLQKQEESIINKIAGNHKITMDEIKKMIKDIDNIKESLEFTQEVIDKKVKTVEEKVETIENKFTNEVQRKLTEIEDRSRRNNIRIEGVVQESYESWDQTETMVNNLLKDKLEIENVKIERAHRTGRTNEEKTRTIVCKLLDYKDKLKIMQNRKKLKGTNIYINEDFSKETREHRKKLWEEVKVLRSQGEIAYLNYRSISQKKREDRSRHRN